MKFTAVSPFVSVVKSPTFHEQLKQLESITVYALHTVCIRLFLRCRNDQYILCNEPLELRKVKIVNCMNLSDYSVRLIIILRSISVLISTLVGFPDISGTVNQSDFI